MDMTTVIGEKRFSYVSVPDKAFIIAFDKEMKMLGYEPFDNEIGSGFCWAPYMIVYAKVGVKAKQVAARIYIREGGIVLRLFLNKIDSHCNYIEKAPFHIKSVFTGEHGKCNHCHNEHDGICKFRKTYMLDDIKYEKCNGVTFEFWEPNLEKLPDYINLLKEFYIAKKIKEFKTMPRPTTKADLISAANEQFDKLWELIDSMTDKEQNAAFLFEDRDKNLRDVLMHLAEWHKMMESWHKIGTLDGGIPDVPGKGYTWRSLPDLNLELWKRMQGFSLADSKTMLKESHQMIMKLIELHTNDQLFQGNVYKWTKSSTLGAYFASNTSSHYEWAMKKIKKHIKGLKNL